MKTKRELEKIFKGVSNHRRVEILILLHRKPNLSVVEISEELKTNFKTIAEHIKKMHISGLVYKTNKGAAVCHTLSPRGLAILEFCRTLE